MYKSRSSNDITNVSTKIKKNVSFDLVNDANMLDVQKFHSHYCKKSVITSKLTTQEGLLYQAVTNGDLNKVKKFLKQNINPNIVINGYSLLMIAILNNMQNNLPLVELLLSYNADPNIKSLNKYTPLYVAIWFGKYDLLLTLLEHGANLDKNYEDHLGAKLLHTAVLYQYLEITKFLLNEGFDPNCLTKYAQQTPLHIAVIKKNINIIRLLLANNADPQIIDAYGFTPIDLANNSNNELIINLFKNDEKNYTQTDCNLCLLKKFQDSFGGKSNIQRTIEFLDDNTDNTELLSKINEKLRLSP